MPTRPRIPVPVVSALLLAALAAGGARYDHHAAPGGSAGSAAPAGTASTPDIGPLAALPVAHVGPAKVVYLTFDDGPHPRWTPQILQVLNQYQVRATFFVVGQQAARYGALARREHAAGHGIGNHTWSHRSLRGVSYARFRQEALRTQQVLGPLDSRCLRPPYGAMDSHTRQYAHSLGYRLVLWTVDPRDWQRPGANVIAGRVLSQVHPGSIVVLHDAGGDRAQTVAALRMFLPRLRAAGYRMAPICREDLPDGGTGGRAGTRAADAGKTDPAARNRPRAAHGLVPGHARLGRSPSGRGGAVAGPRRARAPLRAEPGVDAGQGEPGGVTGRE